MYGLSATPSSNSLPASIPGLSCWLDITFFKDFGNTNKPVDRSGHLTGLTSSQLATASTLKNGTITSLRCANTSATITLTGNITTKDTMTFFGVLFPSTNAPYLSGAVINHCASDASGHLVITDGTNTATSTGTFLNGGQFCTFAAVMSGAAGAVSFYSNGLLDSSSGTITMSGAGTIQAAFHDHAAALTGPSFAEFLIYSSALSANQIAQLHGYARERWFDSA